MDKAEFLNKFLGRKLGLVILTSVLLLTVILSQVALSQQADGTDRTEVVRQVARKWIQVGVEQYDRGLYKASEQSLLRAYDYREYLTAVERKELDELLEKTHIAVVGKGHVLGQIQQADEFVKRGELDRARACLQEAQEDKFLTKEEQKLIVKKLDDIDNRLTSQKKEVIIPSKLTETKSVSVSKSVQKPQVLAKQEESVVAAVTETSVVEPTIDGEDSYIKVINRRSNILRSHTKAVVNDAVAKAEDFISKGEFNNANEAVELAERTVSKNELYLGEELFKQYSDQLSRLAEQITLENDQRGQQLQAQKHLEAAGAQRQRRDEMEADRSHRISELMDNAVAYQKQQRYEEALGQLDGLLAIDPLNDQALILKQTLEDIVNFRKQLEIQKESREERVKTLIKADESMIPYAEELTYPKNWREIAASPFRKAEEAFGLDPADAVVYEQLNEIVDLSALTAEMPFSEAIEQFEDTVEPSLTIIPLWRDLYDNADIDQTTAINMDAISAIPLKTGLELLLKSVAGGFADLGYIVEGGVITIATMDSLPSKLETLVYDITDLLGRPATFYAQSGGGSGGAGGGGTAGGEGFGDEDEMDRDQLAEEALARSEELIRLIQDSIEPDSWYDVGGEGAITVYGNKKLIVRQTRDVHNRIEKLLKEIRKSLGHQVAIEARFLLVGENFLEDIGLDVDFTRYPQTEIKQGEWDVISGNIQAPLLYSGAPIQEGEYGEPLPDDPDYLPEPGEAIRRRPSYVGPTGKLNVRQDHLNHIIPFDTGITGSWPSLMANPALSLGIGGMILDSLQADLLLRATQAHRDSKSLTAPKVSVLSGESASLRVQKIMGYPEDYEFDIQEIGDFGQFYWTVDVEDAWIITGTLLNITPTITPDKKNVLLNIVTELRDFLGFTPHTINLPNIEGTGGNWTINYPETEVSRVETRVSVPDGGTLLLGGQKVTAEIQLESGVPVLSKIPFIGRLFSNRSEIRDQKILLILVKPTVILQEEAEAEAVAAMK